MSDDWKDCERPWTIDEFLEARERSTLDETHLAVWSTERPTEDGHYWFKNYLGFLDVLEISLGEAYLGEKYLEEGEAALYGPRIPTIKAPR